jgi:ribonuclease J
MVIIAVNRQSGQLIGRPDIVSRGFIDPKEARNMIEKSRDLVAQALGHGHGRQDNWGHISSKIKDILDRFYYEQTKSRPMILPFMVKV